MEYMNVHSKAVKRLGCFSNITGDFGRDSEGDRGFSGNAHAYEKQLDRILRQNAASGSNANHSYKYV